MCVCVCVRAHVHVSDCFVFYLNILYKCETFNICIVGRDSVVSIVTCYRLDGPGIESWWGQDFLHSSRLALGSPFGVPYDGYWICFLAVKKPGGGIDHPSLSGVKVKERVELCLCSPYGPSWPVLR
jgi:hypothetical protein